MYEFDWSSIVPSLPYLLDGLVITLKITVTAVVIGILWGTMLALRPWRGLPKPTLTYSARFL